MPADINSPFLSSVYNIRGLEHPLKSLPSLSFFFVSRSTFFSKPIFLVLFLRVNHRYSLSISLFTPSLLLSLSIRRKSSFNDVDE